MRRAPPEFRESAHEFTSGPSRVKREINDPAPGAAAADGERSGRKPTPCLKFRGRDNDDGRRSAARRRAFEARGTARAPRYNVRPDTFALSMVNSAGCLSPSPFRPRRLYVAISNGRASEGKRVRARLVVGYRRRRFSRPADGGGNQGNPTHGACTGRAIGEAGEEGGGGSSTDGARIKPPGPRVPFPASGSARRLAPRRYALSL